MDFRGFDSSIILIQRGGILMSIGDLPECLSQAILVGIMLVGRLGVFSPMCKISLLSLLLLSLLLVVVLLCMYIYIYIYMHLAVHELLVARVSRLALLGRTFDN